MGRSKDRYDCHQQGRDENASLPDKKGTGMRNSVFGPFPNLEMLSWMKLAATEAFDLSSTENEYKMQKQILKLRKFMTLISSEAPQHKRKLKLFLKDQRKAPGNSNYQKISKLKMSCVQLSPPGSAASCLLNASASSNGSSDWTVKSLHSSVSSLTGEDNLHGKQSSPLCLLNTTYLDVPREDMSPILDSVESLTGSKASSMGNVSPNYLPILDLNESVHGSNISNTMDPMNEYLKKPRRSTRLLNFVGDYIQTVVVPVGPRFQADIPEWTGPACRGSIPYDANNSEELKWLGTKIWPPEGRASEFRGQRVIGKGRSDSCLCCSPGSKDCIRRHTLEQRRVLKGALGPAFFSWKFDEMGEEVAKSWTSKEQEKFSGFMISSSVLNRSGFWKNALKLFPSKSRESIVSYYFNVFIPREMTRQNSGLIENVDAEVDESEGAGDCKDTKHKGKVKKAKGR